MKYRIVGVTLTLKLFKSRFSVQLLKAWYIDSLSYLIYVTSEMQKH